ncbi:MULTISPECIES: hypothetical protein [unclassified Streptomyces]|uniref:hypothetical protein n=1 Tax=unclassified Streptomyces TaxID=2593676 RepID=UPI000367B4CE|nr:MULTISPECIES: hypothetical protein [unclassified Streptomyces]MYX33443.1 hypothetical protein [Streptomyces sp. SID8377]
MIPDDFALNDTMRRWVRATFPELDPDFETTQFVSYWRAEGRRKRNWREAWQKWIRDSAKRTRDQQQRPHLRTVKPGGYQPFQPPTDPSVYANGF